MVEGFVDAASAYEIVLVFARRRPEQSYKMEWDRALEVTATLISADCIRLAPSPRREHAASGPYGLFLDGLKPAVRRIVLPDEATTWAIRRTKNWARANVNKLRSVLSTFTGDSSERNNQAVMWLDAHIQSEWYEHARRHGALFDSDFAKQIAKTLDVSQNDLLKLWSLTTDSSFVADLVVRRPDTEEFRLIRDAFVVSSLLRGRYHEYAAEKSETQILSHPVREPILHRFSSSSRISIEVSNTERYLANIAVASAFAERAHKARVALWVENVLNLRRGRDQMNLEEKDRDEKAQQTAIDAARQAGVRTHSKLLENCLDAGAAFGSAALTSFALHPWWSMLVGSSMYAISRQNRLGRRIGDAFFSTPSKLNRLSRLGPGRISGS